MAEIIGLTIVFSLAVIGTIANSEVTNYIPFKVLGALAKLTVVLFGSALMAAIISYLSSLISSN